MSLFASWRTALRIARREAGRAKGRSALVVAMIAMPVLCLAFAAASYDMFTLTGAEKADHAMGTADARLRWPSRDPVHQDPQGNIWSTAPMVDPASGDDGSSAGTPDEGTRRPTPTQADLVAQLPSGSRALPLLRGTIVLKTHDGVAEPNAVSVDARDPLTAGYLKIRDGRAPQAPNEVALSDQAMARFGQGIGGKVTSGDGHHVYSVVGQVEFPSSLAEFVLLPPISGQDSGGPQLSDQTWLVSTPTPITWDDMLRLNQIGISGLSRQVLIDPPPADTVATQYNVRPADLAIGVIVAGLALLEIVLLAGPAFAVSARRRQRQLALVAANGGTPAHVRRIVLADGVVLGAVGAVVGIVVGIGAAFLARPVLEEHFAFARAGGYRVFPSALLAIALLAVVTGVLAALVPAFITARQNVIASLAGRRGATRSRKRWIVLGLVMVAAGGALVLSGSMRVDATVMLAGMVVAELGLVLCTPALVGLIARLGRVLPLAPRIALRDAARNRAAAAPAISAVMAAVAGSIGVGLYLQSNITMQVDGYQAVLPSGYAMVYLPPPGSGNKVGPAPTASITQVEQTARAILPVTDVKTVGGMTCVDAEHPDRQCWLTVVTPPDRECPYLVTLQTGRALSKDDQRAAAADPRCDRSHQSQQNPYIVDDGNALAMLTGATPEDVSAASAVLRAGGIVVSDPAVIRDGMATIEVNEVSRMQSGASGDDTAGDDTPPRVSAPAYALGSGIRLSAPIVSPGLVTKAGLRVTDTPQGIVVSTNRMATQAESDRFNQKMQDLNVGGFIERGPHVQIPVQLWIMIAAAGLITLGAAAIGTGLAAADGRADMSTLAAVGASPRLRRGLSVSQSGVIAGLGSVLGTAAGLGTGIAILFAFNQQFADTWPAPPERPIVLPWISLGIALVVIPAIAILGAGLLTRSRLPIERRI